MSSGRRARPSRPRAGSPARTRAPSRFVKYGRSTACSWWVKRSGTYCMQRSGSGGRDADRTGAPRRVGGWPRPGPRRLHQQPNGRRDERDHEPARPALRASVDLDRQRVGRPRPRPGVPARCGRRGEGRACRSGAGGASRGARGARARTPGPRPSRRPGGRGERRRFPAGTGRSPRPPWWRDR